MKESDNSKKKVDGKRIALIVLAVVIVLAIAGSCSRGGQKNEASGVDSNKPAVTQAKSETTKQESVDTSTLEGLIEKAESVDTSKYTDDSVAALTSALDAARGLLAKEGFSASDVSDATTKLNKALDSLVERIDPVVLTGSGDDVVEIPGNLSVCLVTASYSGGGNFAIWSLDGENNNIDLLVNEIGSYEGTTATGQRSGVAKYLQVKASSEWTITLSPISSAPTVENGSTMKGDSVVFVNAGSSGKLSFTNDGDSNFVVYGINESSASLLVNEIGSYDGSVPNKGYKMLIVRSNGNWTVSW